MVVRANYTLVVEAHRYINEDHRRLNGGCCGSFCLCRIFECACSNRFIFCLRPFTDLRNTSTNDCTGVNPHATSVSKFTTGEVASRNDNFTFETLQPHSSLGVMTFHGRLWPVSLLPFFPDPRPVSLRPRFSVLQVTESWAEA